MLRARLERALCTRQYRASANGESNGATSGLSISAACRSQCAIIYDRLQFVDPSSSSASASLLVGPERAHELRRSSVAWRSLDLGPRALCDLELLLTGAFAPLGGFLGPQDVESVGERMRLANGALWPIPITLDVEESLARSLKDGEPLVLCDGEGTPLAVQWVDEVFAVDRWAQAERIFGTLDRAHPGVDHLLERTPGWALAGRLEGLATPHHADFADLRLTPAQVRAEIGKRGWERVVGFQTRNPMHRAHFAMTARALREHEAAVLVHPAVGATRPGDVDVATRVRCYRHVLRHYPAERALLALLPIAMRMAGPREALWHALVRRNFGCTHFTVGRDHAGPGADRAGRPFYPPYAAQELALGHQAELGLRIVPFDEMVWVEERQEFVPRGEVPAGATIGEISGSEVRRRLERRLPLPAWFTFPEVAQELERRHPPRPRRGLVVFFSGLSGAGKSTLARHLQARLLEFDARSVTLLDGDMVRRHLSSELGFSRQHRDLNVHRIGFVAAEVARAGGIALCAPIAPYDAARREARRLVRDAGGGFVLVHVATPIAVCEARDRKGLYAKARAGLVAGFTGVSDPYEEPEDAEVRVDTTNLSIDQATGVVWSYLLGEGWVSEEEWLPAPAGAPVASP